MGNAGLEEAQAEIKIAGRNINNLRYADNPIYLPWSDGTGCHDLSFLYAEF